MSFKNFNYFPTRLKAVVFMLLAGSCTAAIAQTPAHISHDTETIETPNNVDKSSKQDSEKSEKIKSKQAEEYNIYRKESPNDPCDRGLDTYNYETSWYDESQAYVNSQFCEPALWFDNFFANDRVFREGVPGTYIRWRNEFIDDQEENFKFKTDLNFSFELPGLQDRLRLTFESDEDETLRDITPGNNQNSTNSLGLQLDVAKNTRSKFNISVSFSPRIRLRYRYTYPVLPSITLRFTQEVQREKALNSSRTLFDFEKLFDNKLLFRSSSEGKLSEDFDGANWLQAFILYQRVSKKSSFSYEASANGITQPLALALNYRLGIRFRKNFHRRWLFYEIAPEMTWPITLNRQQSELEKGRRSKWLIFFRLEVHFGNAYKKRYQDYN